MPINFWILPGSVLFFHFHHRTLWWNQIHPSATSSAALPAAWLCGRHGWWSVDEDLPPRRASLVSGTRRRAELRRWYHHQPARRGNVVSPTHFKKHTLHFKKHARASRGNLISLFSLLADLQLDSLMIKKGWVQTASRLRVNYHYPVTYVHKMWTS